MFNNKQVKDLEKRLEALIEDLQDKDLEMRLETLIEELQDNKVLGESWFGGYSYAPHNNEKLARDIKTIVTELNSQANTIAALMEYFEVEYVEETIKEIRTIK